MNPQWPLQGFIMQDHEGNQEVKVYMLLGLHGGGPKLKSVSEVRNDERSGMLTHMAAFEAENFEAALRHVTQKLADETDRRMYVDIANYLDLEICFMHDLLCLKA